MDLKDYFGANLEHVDFDDLLLDVNCLILASQLSSGEIDTLNCAMSKGFMDSGDTPSKSARSELLSKGILCQTCSNKTSYSFSVSYPLGWKVVQARKALKAS